MVMSQEAKQLGRYLLVQQIGRGGMAEVWTGKLYGASGFEKVVAIKLLAKKDLDKETYRHALRHEALVAAQLKHPNIVDVYELNIEADQPYLVMEYIEGIELRTLLQTLRVQSAQIEPNILLYIICEVSKALSHAHTRRNPDTGKELQIVHRDVTPSNILISHEGAVKLSDFGIAKSVLQRVFTQAGDIKGKFRYMSPEQARGDAIDYRSDIFSLGLVFYECLFGHPAYEAETDAELLKRAQTGSISYPTEVDHELKQILEQLLAPRPEDRYSDLNQFRKELAAFALRHGKIPDNETLSEFLKRLEIPRLKQASQARKEAEDWVPRPESQVINEEGQLTTVVISPPRSRVRYYAAGLVTVGIATVLYFAWPETPPIVELPPLLIEKPVEAAIAPEPEPTSGTLAIKTNPSGATVEIRVGKSRRSEPAPASFNEVPFGKTVKVSVSKAGYQTVKKELKISDEKPTVALDLILKKTLKTKVTFMASPYAEVTIPGHVAAVETPATKRLSPGKYKMTFFHPPTNKLASAQLSAKSGGSYICVANMHVTNEAKAASASCRRQ